MHRSPRRFKGRSRFWAAAGFLAGWTAMLLCGNLASEGVTLTTYYPAPSGVYQKLITTGQTWLARDSGGVGVGTGNPITGATRLAVMGGRLGVGTETPTADLHVVGSFRLEDGTQANGHVLTTDANGVGHWQAPLTAANFVTRVGPNAHDGTGSYTQVNCQAGEIMVSGGCDARLEPGPTNPTSVYGGMPIANGWQCPRWDGNVTTAYVRCYAP